MHFKLKKHDQHPHFYPYGQYEIKNLELAELMVKHSLNRMYEINLFGNGYPVSPPRACLLYTSPSPRDLSTSRMPSSA